MRQRPIFDSGVSNQSNSNWDKFDPFNSSLFGLGVKFEPFDSSLFGLA